MTGRRVPKQSSLLVNLNAIGPAPTVTGWQPADQEGVRSLRTRNSESVPGSIQNPSQPPGRYQVSVWRLHHPLLVNLLVVGTNRTFPAGGALAGSRTPDFRIHKEIKTLLNWLTTGSGIPLGAISRIPSKPKSGVVNQNASVSPASLQSETPKPPEPPPPSVSIETPSRLFSPQRHRQPLQNTCEISAWFAVRAL